MKFKVGDIVRVEKTYRDYLSKYYGVGRDDLFIIDSYLSSNMYRCINFFREKYTFDFLDVELQLALECEIKEEDIL